MKKVLLILLSVALVLSMAGAVAGAHNGATTSYVDQDTGTTSSAVPVSLTIAEKYTVKIPTYFEFTYSSTLSAYSASADISVDIDLIGQSEHVWVNVSSAQYNNGWVMKSDNQADTVEYEYLMDVSDGANSHPLENLEKGDTSPIINGGAVISVPDTQKDEVIKTIHLKMVDTPIAAAVYTDQLTFTINVGHLS